MDQGFQMEYFLSDSQMIALDKAGIHRSLFQLPVILPKSNGRKAQCIWQLDNIENVSKIIQAGGFSMRELSALTGLTLPSLYNYKNLTIHRSIRYSTWRSLALFTSERLLGNPTPKPNEFMFDSSVRAVLVPFFEEESFRLPDTSQPTWNGVATWISPPTCDQVAYLFDELSKVGVFTPQLMQAMGIDDRTVRRKRATSAIDLTQFMALCSFAYPIIKKL
jgi:hypothetical protein